MYKLVQNYLMSDEYEYCQDYDTIDEAQKDLEAYEQDDKEQGKSYSYTIIDKDGNDALEQEQAEFENEAIEAMESIGLTKDEAERQLEDLKTF